jgi:hypothetical protein
MKSVSCFIALSSKAARRTRGHELANDFRQSQEEKTRLPEKPNARPALLYALRFFRFVERDRERPARVTTRSTTFIVAATARPALRPATSAAVTIAGSAAFDRREAFFMRLFAI